MQNIFIALLAICIVGVMVESPWVGIVLAGLLAMVAWTMSRSNQLRTRVEQLEKRLAEINTVGKETSAAAVQHPAIPTPTPQEPGASHYANTAQASTVTESVPRPVPVVPEKAPAQAAGKEWAAQPRQVPPAARQTQTHRVERKPTAPKTPVLQPFVLKLFQWVWDWFTGGNVFVRVGIVILFMGMTFLIQHAVGKNMIPIGLRLAAVAAAAIALLYWGWRQRDTRSNFALVVQGGGIGLLYLTIFASFSLYGVIPSPAAFALLAVVVVLAAILAVLQDARSLALFATVGGFLAPVLTSSGSNNYIGLFSYYTLLNVGVFTIAWFKSWRLLNLVGFVFTFGVSTVWGVLSYEPEFFATTQPFLIIFFLLYVAISILFANRREPFYKDYVDSTLVFGTPLLAFGLQCAMVKQYEYGVAISAAVLGTFYILLTQFIWSRYRDSLKLLSETFLSLGVIFLTLAVPFAIDGTLTGATWAIEGAGILWVSIKQQQKYRRLFGQALVAASGVMLGYELLFVVPQAASYFSYAFLNSAFIGCVIIAVAASVCSWLLSRPFPGKIQFEKQTAYALLGYGLTVLLLGFEYQVFEFELLRAHGSLLAVLTSVCVLLYSLAGDKLQWRQAHWVAVGFVVPMIFAACLCYAYQPQLAANYGYLVWPLTALIYCYALKRALPTMHPRILIAAHILWALIIVALLFWEGLWQLMLGYAMLTVGFNIAADKWRWPQLKLLALGFLPVMVLVASAAISMDGNLISLSSIGAGVTWPFPPGFVLWPMAFAIYFYVLHQNPTVKGVSTSGLHYGGAGLIAALFLWLGLWPLLLAASLLTVLCCYLWQRLSWEQMRITATALLPVMLVVAVWKLRDGSFDMFALESFNVDFQFGFEVGYVLWPLAFGVLFWSFRQFDKQSLPAFPLWHGLALLLLVGLLTWEASWHLLDYVGVMNGWHLALLPLTTLLALRLVMKPPCWPFTVHFEDYRRFALAPLALALISWSLLQLFSSGDSAPLPWLPLLNPIGIVQAIIAMVAFLWFRNALSVLASPPSARVINISLLTFVFVWANVDLLRAVHHWAGVAWELPTIFTADISQMVLSLFWALCGLATTFYAGRKAQRYLWIAGAALLGAVILKLFLVDLSASGTVERIVSFTGVGLLLVLVGYFSPIPPNNIPPNKRTTDDKDSSVEEATP